MSSDAGAPPKPPPPSPIGADDADSDSDKEARRAKERRRRKKEKKRAHRDAVRGKVAKREQPGAVWRLTLVPMSVKEREALIARLI